MAAAASSDRAILVHSELDHSFPGLHREDVSLELTNGSLTSLKFGVLGSMPVMDSPSETCTTLSTVSTVTASPLDQKHRHHMFFAYHPEDVDWVRRVVEKLEDEPYNFRCCFAERDYDDRVTALQNALCCIMLSQWVIVVLTPAFVDNSWAEYEESISHLTSLSQRRQRVVPIILEECDIPESLRMMQPVEACHGLMDWEALFQSLHLNGLPYSESLHTIRSITAPSPGYINGQVLSQLTANIKGFWKSQLLFDYDEVPDALTAHDVSLGRQDYADMVKIVGREEHGVRLSWLFSGLPTILLFVVFILWCISFILIILLFPDDEQSTLPVRLCVFSLPAIFIVLSCVFRWRKLKTYKEKIYFMYFNRTDCVECIKLFLTHCTDEDIMKLCKLIEVYTLNSGYLDGKPLAVRLAVMLSSAYAINLVFKRIPHSLEQRHTRRRQCLCQFVEEFLAAYLPCIRQEVDVNNIKFVFFRYLNCQIRPDPVVLHTLGMSLVDT